MKFGTYSGLSGLMTDGWLRIGLTLPFFELMLGSFDYDDRWGISCRIGSRLFWVSFTENRTKRRLLKEATRGATTP